MGKPNHITHHQRDVSKPRRPRKVTGALTSDQLLEILAWIGRTTKNVTVTITDPSVLNLLRDCESVRYVITRTGNYRIFGRGKRNTVPKWASDPDEEHEDEIPDPYDDLPIEGE